MVNRAGTQPAGSSSSAVTLPANRRLPNHPADSRPVPRREGRPPDDATAGAPSLFPLAARNRVEGEHNGSEDRERVPVWRPSNRQKGLITMSMITVSRPPPPIAARTSGTRDRRRAASSASTLAGSPSGSRLRAARGVMEAPTSCLTRR